MTNMAEDFKVGDVYKGAHPDGRETIVTILEIKKGKMLYLYQVGGSKGRKLRRTIDYMKWALENDRKVDKP